MAAGFEPKIEDRLLGLPQVCMDTTTVRMDGHLACICCFSERQWGIYVPMERKNIEALSIIPII